MADLGNIEEISDLGHAEEASVPANSSSKISDSFQKLLELADNYKSETAAKMPHSNPHVQDESCLTETNGQDHQIPLQMKSQFDEIAINATKKLPPESLVCQTLSPSSSLTGADALSKLVSGGVANQKPASAGTCRLNFTVPHPFSLATDKQSSFVGRPRDENDTLQKGLLLEENLQMEAEYNFIE